MAKPDDILDDSEDEGVSLHAALKLVAWGSVAASAAALVVLVAQTEAGTQRLAGILSGPTRAVADSMPVQKANPLAARLAETESEALRLGETVRRLTADRDKVAARLDALERNAEVTGSIRDSGTARDASTSPPAAASPVVASEAPAAQAAPTPTGPPVLTPQQVASLPPAVTLGPAAAPAPAAAEAQMPRPGAITPLPPALLTPPPPAIPLATDTTNPVNGPAADSVATRTEFGVDLGGDRTVDALRALWTSLRVSRHATLFAGLRPLVAIREVGKPGSLELRLVVGPLVNAGAAARLCGKLAAAGLACQPAVFDGQRLALR